MKTGWSRRRHLCQRYPSQKPHRFASVHKLEVLRSELHHEVKAGKCCYKLCATESRPCSTTTWQIARLLLLARQAVAVNLERCSMGRSALQCDSCDCNAPWL